ncbi:hypothetical protein KBW71_03275 [Hydrogenophaga aromaticivorans]|uniref:hypothetical protein n=1 Tax=Hydrogenophaga aromaticivorans TaxID=2610898 RepID=UPI001B37BFCB|nr:hypothetical protein [Hydrogenophaga aromaticivorans]MBQ0917450.1 hypothetical protein [Hydrogenophaga aromaticivorans]
MAHLYGKKAKAPQNMPGDGRAVMIDDTYSVAANPTDGDVVNFRLPAGIRLGMLDIRCDDLDTGTPEIVFSVGYRAADSDSDLSASAAYFAAAGQTTAQGGGTLHCSFEPIKFEEDVYVTITIATNSATFAAGDICMIAVGAAEGVK